jgi:Flp pilus assembly protein TadG
MRRTDAPRADAARGSVEGAARGRRRAQAAVEFALVMPLFLLIVAGTIEFGRIFFSYAQLLQAAQDGARYGAILQKADSDVTARVKQLAPGGNSDTVSIATTVSPTSNASVASALRTRGNVLRVSAQHQHRPLVPVIRLPTISLTATASMVVE